MRTHAVVREATPDDLPDLLALWRLQRDLAGRAERAFPEPTVEGALDLLARSNDDPARRILVAVSDRDVVGLLVLSAEPAGLFDGQAVQIHCLQVRPGSQRRGIGKLLVAAAAGFAEEVGADHVVTNVLPHLRDANRFYARLGFGPVVVQRVAAVPLLRRRLAADRRHGALDELLSRRRSTRSRSLLAAGGPLPAGD